MKVRITAYDSRPAPATLFIRLVMDKAKPETYTNWGDDNNHENDNNKSSSSSSLLLAEAAAASTSSSSQNKPTEPSGGDEALPGGIDSAEAASNDLLLSASETAAMQDMLKLGPLLQTLLSLLGEPERGVDEDAVTLLQQVDSSTSSVVYVIVLSYLHIHHACD